MYATAFSFDTLNHRNFSARAIFPLLHTNFLFFFYCNFIHFVFLSFIYICLLLDYTMYAYKSDKDAVTYIMLTAFSIFFE